MAEVKSSQDDTHAPVEAPSSAPAKRRILLIEDDSRTRLVLWDKLRSSGFEVIHASNGVLGMEKLRTGPIPDAIFMDLLLPFIKGVEVIREVREDKDYANMPIFVCTSADNMDAWRRRGTKAGATKVFDKASTPIDAIIAEVTAAVLARPPAPTVRKKKPPVESPPAAKSSTKSSSTILDSMKISLKSLGFGKAKDPGKAPAKPAEPPKAAPPPTQITATQATISATPPANPAADQPLGLLRPSTPPAITTANPALPAPHKGTFGPPPTPQFPVQDPFADAGGGLPFDLKTAGTQNAVAVLTLDSYGKIVTADGASTTMFGWQSSELVGKQLQALMKNDASVVLGTLLQKAKPGETNKLASVRISALRKNGTEFRASVTRLTWSTDTSMVSKFGGAHWTAVFRDLTAVPESAQPPPPSPEAALPRGGNINLAGAPPELPPHSGTAFVTQLKAQMAAGQFQQLPPSKEHEELRKQFEAVSAEAAKNREMLDKAESERKELLERVESQDEDLARERTALEREITARKSLEEKFQDLAAKRDALEKQVAELTRAKDEALSTCEGLRGEVQAAKASAERSRVACEKEAERAREFEAEITRLQQAYNDLNASFGHEQSKSAEFRQRADDLELQLRENTSEIEQIRGELEKQTSDRQTAEADWSREIASLAAKCRHFQNAWQEEAQRNRDVDERVRLLGNSLRLEQTEHVTRLGQELSALREGRYELDAKLATEQQAASEARRRADEFETKLRESAAEITRVRSEQEAQLAERERLETEWRNQLGTAETLARNLESALKEAADRNRRFEEEVVSLRQVRDDLNARLAAEEKAVAESQARIAELDRQLRRNAAELERAKAELAKADRAKHAEGQLASLYEVRDRLSNQLTSEQQVAAASQQRTENLEKELRTNTLELNRLKVERDRHAEQQARQQSELRAQLEAAQSAARETDAALKRKAQECARFEKQIARIEKARIDLESRLSTTQIAMRESAQRAEALENELQEAAAELERVKTERDRQHASLEAEMQAKLNAALEAKEAVESTAQGQTERNRELERQITALREDREALTVQLRTEKQLAAEAKRRDKEAQARVQNLSSELQRLKAEREKDARGRQSVEAKLNEQLSSAKAMMEQANAALKEKAAAIGKLERDFAALRDERDDFAANLETAGKTANEARQRAEQAEARLRDTAAELDRVKAEREKDGGALQSLESGLNEQLAAAKRTTEQAEAGLKEKTTALTNLERDLAKVREEREAIAIELAAEKEAVAEEKDAKRDLEVRVQELSAELERAIAERQHITRDQTILESNLNTDIAEAKAAAQDAKTALAEKVKLIKRLERDTNNLREERQELCEKFAAEKEAGTKAKRRIKDLEKQLREIAKAFNTAKADLEKRTAGKGKAAADLQGEITAAREAAAKAEAEREEQAARCKEVEEKLAEITETRQEIEARLKSAEARSTESDQRIEQLEKRVREAAAELARAKAATKNQTTRWAKAQSSDGVLAAKSDELVTELARLRENEAAHNAEVTELERRVREGVTSLARATTELEGERSERRRVEHRLSTLTSKLEELHGELRQHLESERETQARANQLEQQVREREQLLIRLNSELRKQTADRELAEEQLRSVGDMSAQLRQYLALFEESKKVFKKAQDQLEARLQNSMANAKAAEDRLQDEVAERARLEEALASTQRAMQEQVEQAAVQLSRVQAELQVEQLERKRLEGGAQHSRFASLDSTRVVRNMMNNFRRQIRQPVESVTLSSRQLLEQDLPAAQKKLVESLLENALLLQSTLEDSDSGAEGQGELRKAA